LAQQAWRQHRRVDRRLNELAVELDPPIGTTSCWPQGGEAFARILERQKTVRHACEAETSMLLALAPELVDMKLAVEAVGPTSREVDEVVGSSAVHRWRSFKSRTSHGAIGDPRLASADKGERLLNAAAEAVARVLENGEFWALPA
jgi:creatinine amidohydrolase